MGGGGGSSSLFGATGAATAAAKATRWVAVLFAATSITLTMFANRKESSVIDNVITVPSSSGLPVETAPTTQSEPLNETSSKQPKE
jgi:preprotein translocase subunit SecG